jgi:hypothetical protein
VRRPAQEEIEAVFDFEIVTLAAAVAPPRRPEPDSTRHGRSRGR